MLRATATRFCKCFPASRQHAAGLFEGPLLFGRSFVRFASSSLHSDNPEDMQFVHHKKKPHYRDYVKFKSPRKRASKLLSELTKDTVEKSKAAKPQVFEVDYQVGDAIECEVVEQGGVESGEIRRVRGIVIGKFNKAMDTSVLIRDVVFGTIVERQLPLHSPLVKNIKMLEKNFIYKGKKKVKRAKLYFLRNRNSNESRVTKGKG